MPRWILLATIAFLALAVPAWASETRVGLHLDLPVPGREIGDHELGIGAGVTFTTMTSAYLGVGFDVNYHYWPTSTAYAEEFDRYWRSRQFQTLASSEFAFTAIQITGHVRAVVWPGHACEPWIQIGLGAYRLDRHLELQGTEGTYGWILPALSDRSTVPGWNASVGLDFRSSDAVTLGLEGTMHWLGAPADQGSTLTKGLPGFSAVTLGAHVLFGRR